MGMGMKVAAWRLFHLLLLGGIAMITHPVCVWDERGGEGGADREGSAKGESGSIYGCKISYVKLP
jgi:hypothetical protein